MHKKFSSPNPFRWVTDKIIFRSFKNVLNVERIYYTDISREFALLSTVTGPEFHNP